MVKSCDNCVHNDNPTAILTKAVCRLCSRLGNWEPERFCSNCKWSYSNHPSGKPCSDTRPDKSPCGIDQHSHWELEKSCSTCKWSSKNHPSMKNCVDNGANPQFCCGSERSLWELNEPVNPKGELSFWMVLVDGSTYTSTRYRNFQDAQNEAISAARLYPGNKYYILQAAYSFQAGEPEIKKEVLL